jgi:hypothetical protein
MTNAEISKWTGDLYQTWATQIRGMVADRLADARAHAMAGVMASAHSRIDELERRVLDRSDGMLSRARCQFYREAFLIHRAGGLDPNEHDRAMEPTAEGQYAAQTASIAGVDQYGQLRRLIEAARDGMQLVRSTDRPTDGPTIRDARWGNWERQNREEINLAVSRVLSDAQMSILGAIGHLLVKPEFR